MNGSDGEIIFEMIDCWGWPEAKALAAAVAMLDTGQVLQIGKMPDAADEEGAWEGIVRVVHYGADDLMLEIPGRETIAEAAPEAALGGVYLTDRAQALLLSRGFTAPTNDPGEPGHPGMWQTRYDSVNTWLVVESLIWIVLEVFGRPDLSGLSQSVGGTWMPDGRVPCLHYLRQHLPPDLPRDQGCQG